MHALYACILTCFLPNSSINNKNRFVCFCFVQKFEGYFVFKVRADWIVAQHSMLTAAQQAQTAVRKRRVMYVLILMVVVFMASWLPLTIVNIFRDFEIGKCFLFSHKPSLAHSYKLADGLNRNYRFNNN